MGTERFFSSALEDIAWAKLLCAGCGVMARCLEGAVRRKEPSGVWGGQLFDNGRIVHVKRLPGRPPKVTPPQRILPDVPVPSHLEHLLDEAG